MSYSAKKYMQRKKIGHVPTLQNPTPRLEGNPFKDRCNLVPYAMTYPDERCGIQPPLGGSTKEYPWTDVSFKPE